MDGGSRFREAMKEKKSDWSINRLAKVLSERGVRGGSYSSIRNYLAKRSEPPLEFLLAAAEVLGVSADYLAYGRGHLDAEHAEVTATTLASIPSEDRKQRMLAEKAKASAQAAGALARDVLRGMGVSPPGPRVIIGPAHYWVSTVAEIRRILRRTYPPDPDQDQPKGVRLPPIPAAVTEDISKALRGPLEALGVDPAAMKDEDIEDYILSMAPVLRRLAKERNRQRMTLLTITIDAKEENDAPEAP